MHTIKSVILMYKEHEIYIGFDRGDKFNTYVPNMFLLDWLLGILYDAQIVPLPDPFQTDAFFLHYDIRERES